MNIGFFDSGLGGLLILKTVAKALPQYDYVYYADTANLPYGDKTEEEIYELTRSAIEELFKRDCLLVVVACNTSSAETLRRIQDTYLKEHYPERKILGVIVPTIEEVVEAQSTRAILLATKRTVESGKYARELEKINKDIELVSIATPELVPLIELHELGAATESAINTIERVAREGDVVVLGCTHYAMLKNPLRAHFKNTLIIVSQDEVIPDKLSDYLSRHKEITLRLSNTGKRQIHLTLHRPDYDQLTAEFLGGVYLPEE
ncbi:MAG: glutamate racemase [Candidatus Pacebacteria bacterium]|nr:glutamate racemase [Candidatus Paceibacterota bacterium]